MTPSSSHSDLPLLTDIINPDGSTAKIPTLTEVVPVARDADTPPASHEHAPMTAGLLWESEPSPPPAERNISEIEMQQLLDHFTSHLESVFTEKLDRHLQQLHHQAIRLAILELKDELPELLRKALNPSDASK